MNCSIQFPRLTIFFSCICYVLVYTLCGDDREIGNDSPEDDLCQRHWRAPNDSAFRPVYTSLFTTGLISSFRYTSKSGITSPSCIERPANTCPGFREALWLRTYKSVQRWLCSLHSALERLSLPCSPRGSQIVREYILWNLNTGNPENSVWNSLQRLVRISK